jgi:hypothetical protein
VSKIEAAVGKLVTQTNQASKVKVDSLNVDLEKIKTSLNSLNTSISSVRITEELNKLQTALANATIKFSEIKIDSSVVSKAVVEELAKIKITVDAVNLDLKSEISKALKTEGIVTVGAMQLSLKNIIQTAIAKEGIGNVANFTVNLAEVIQSELAGKISIKDLALELPQVVVEKLESALTIKDIPNFNKILNDSINSLATRIASDVASLKLFSDDTVVIQPVDLTKRIQEKLNSVEINLDRILVGQLINQRLQEQGVNLDEINIDLNPIISAKLGQINFAEINTSEFVAEVSSYLQTIANSIKTTPVVSSQEIKTHKPGKYLPSCCWF